MREGIPWGPLPTGAGAADLDDLLAGAGVELSDDVLDQIDAIVPPGTEVNPADNYLAASRRSRTSACAAASPGSGLAASWAGFLFSAM